MHNKIYQRKILLVILAISVILVLGIVVIKNKSSKSNLYTNEYYSLILPINCTVQENEFDVSLVYENKKIAMITIDEDFQYGDNVERIVANWIGMKASIKSESSLWTDKNDEFHKVIIETELSAAEEINGEDPKADEVHYFYLSEGKLFIDVLVYDDEYITLIENSIKSLTFK